MKNPLIKNRFNDNFIKIFVPRCLNKTLGSIWNKAARYSCKSFLTAFFRNCFIFITNLFAEGANNDVNVGATHITSLVSTVMISWVVHDVYIEHVCFQFWREMSDWREIHWMIQAWCEGVIRKLERPLTNYRVHTGDVVNDQNIPKLYIMGT